MRLLFPQAVLFSFSSWRSVQRSAAAVIRHVSVRAQTQVGYVTQGGVGGQRELRLAGLGRPVPGLHDGLAQAGDPLLLAEGVVGLQAVRVDLGASSAAHAETVLHYQVTERGRKLSENRIVGFSSTKERKKTRVALLLLLHIVCGLKNTI